MKRLVITASLATVLSLVPGAAVLAASNPSGHGPPSQDCTSIVNSGGTEPGNGHAAQSPGSPFNEPALNGGSGGTGGQHYSESSQYDVACYQVSQH